MQIINAVLTWSLLIVLFVLVGVFLINVLVGVIFYSIFYHKLKKGRRSITIIIQAKYDILSKVIELIPSTKIDKSILDIYSSIDVLTFRKVEKDVFKTSKDNLSIVKNELIKIIKEDENLSNNNEIETLISNINENDECYRSRIVNYNSNVQGFNYWIKFLPSRFIFKIAKIKEKSPLS